MEMTFRRAVEVIWIITSAVGLGAAIYGVVDVYKDYCAAKVYKGRGVSYLFARSILRSQLFRTLKLATLLAAGIISISIPPATPWRRIVLILLLLAVTLATSADSILDRTSKRQIMHKLSRGDDRHAFDMTGEMPIIKRSDL